MKHLYKSEERDAKEEHCVIYVLLGSYGGWSGNVLRTFRDIPSVPSSRTTHEGGTDRLSWNVGAELPLRCVRPRRAQLWFTLRLKPENTWIIIFYVFLTVHLSIFILVIIQLDAQNLFNNKFISCLYLFRAPCAHRQEVKNCIIQPMVSSHL